MLSLFVLLSVDLHNSVVYLIDTSNIRIDIADALCDIGHGLTLAEFANILVIIIDDLFDLVVGVGLEDDGLEFPTRLQLAVQLDGQVDHIRDEDKDEFGSHAQPLEHIVKKMLLLDEMIDFVQDNYLSLLILGPPV